MKGPRYHEMFAAYGLKYNRDRCLSYRWTNDDNTQWITIHPWTGAIETYNVPYYEEGFRAAINDFMKYHRINKQV